MGFDHPIRGRSGLGQGNRNSPSFTSEFHGSGQGPRSDFGPNRSNREGGANSGFRSEPNFEPQCSTPNDRHLSSILLGAVGVQEERALLQMRWTIPPQSSMP